MAAPADESYSYVRPDDFAPKRIVTWREELTKYNEAYGQENPYRLFPAYRLYANHTYVDLVEQFGPAGVFVLSAGWGLVRSDFLLPHYDITFSASAEPYKRRRTKDRYADFCHLPSDCDESIVFFGGKDYLSLFCTLTADLTCERVVFFNSSVRPVAPGCRLVRYHTKARTNWHYECVREFLAGRLSAAPTSAR